MECSISEERGGWEEREGEGGREWRREREREGEGEREREKEGEKEGDHLTSSFAHIRILSTCTHNQLIT